jgi:hypothetical protein
VTEHQVLFVVESVAQGKLTPKEATDLLLDLDRKRQLGRSWLMSVVVSSVMIVTYLVLGGRW